MIRRNEVIRLFIHSDFGDWLKIKWEIYEICSKWWARWKRVWGIYWKFEKSGMELSEEEIWKMAEIVEDLIENEDSV